MIGPEEIRRKALNLYPAWQLAWRRQPAVSAGLTPAETTAFEICCRENLRIEQEQLPQEHVLRILFRNDFSPLEAPRS